jgi:hypothetical protein
MMLRHPQKVTLFYGINTFAPWTTFELSALQHLWRFGYQIPISLPVIGPRVIGDPNGRYLRLLMRWVGAGFMPNEEGFQLYVQRMTQPGPCGRRLTLVPHLSDARSIAVVARRIQ